MQKLNIIFFAVAVFFAFISVNQAAALPPSEIQVKLDGFKSSDLIMKGTASVQDSGSEAGYLRLTPAVPYVAGSAFYREALDISKTRSFSAYFTMKISDTGLRGADGLMFIISDQAYEPGKNGGGIGYHGVRNSVAVEFDTFHNLTLYGDKDGNHIAINANGDLSKPLAITGIGELDQQGIVLDDGALRHVWIEYDGARSIMEVRVAGDSKRPASPQLQLPSFRLDTIMKQPEIHIGFTSATGKFYGSHKVGKLFFDNRYYEHGIPLDDVMKIQLGGSANSLSINTKPTVEAGNWTNEVGMRFVNGKIVANDIENDTLKFFVTELPKHGTLQLNNETGSFVYTAHHRYEGADSFKVKVSDGKLLSDESVQSLNLLNANELPVLEPQQVKVVAGDGVDGIMKGLDKNNDELSFAVHSAPLKGNVVLNEFTGTFRYIANEESKGNDRFYVIANDGIGNSSPVLVQISISPKPIHALSRFEQVLSAVRYENMLLYAPTNRLRSSLKFSIVESVSSGTLTLNPNGSYQYISDKGFVGKDRFTFIVKEGDYESAPAEVLLNVEAAPRIAYMYGYRDGLFKPQQAITRGELAAAIVRLTEMQQTNERSTRSGAKSLFVDVSMQNWMYREIETVHTHRIMSADLKGNFAPNRPLTRLEMRMVIQRLLQKKHIQTDGFKQAVREVSWLANTATAQTKRDTLKVSRLETVKIMNALFKRKLSANTISGKTVWHDVPPTHRNYSEIMRVVE